MSKKMLLVALILLFLTACSKNYVVKIDPRLTVPCYKPEITGDTYRDVVVLAIQRGDSIDECNARLEVIRSTQ